MKNSTLSTMLKWAKKRLMQRKEKPLAKHAKETFWKNEVWAKVKEK